MKRRLAGLLLIIVMMPQLAMLTSCDNEDTHTEKIRYKASQHYMYTVTEEGLFSKEDDLIHFISSETHEDIIFCANPVCEHEPASSTNPDPECRAALFEGRTYILYYEEYIYYIVQNGFEDHQLYRMNVSSGVRERIGTYPYGKTAVGYAIYEDCMYYNAMIYEKPMFGSALISYAVMLEINLKDGSYRIIREREEESNYVASRFDVRDNTMFAVIDDEEGDYLAKINLETLEETVLIKPEDMSNKFYEGIYDGDSYYYSTSDEMGICNTVTGEDTVLIKLKEEEQFWGAWMSNRGILYRVGKDDEMSYYFYDVNTKNTWDITDRQKELNINIRDYDGYADKFIVYAYGEPDTEGNVPIVGHDSYDVQDILAESRKVK